jgi:molecular chaperone GrpE
MSEEVTGPDAPVNDAEKSSEPDAAAGDVLDVAVEVEAPPPPPPGPEVRIAELEAALAKAEQEKKDNWDKVLRTAADLENHRRRSKRDMDDARAESKQRVLKEMLPVVDNLERALQHAEQGQTQTQAGENAAILDGVRLVLRQFTQAFERCDVTAVDAQGQPFDPNVHEAISQQETDAQPAGTVVSVLQKGYKLGDRLLRPALVVVAKAPPAKPVEAPAADAAPDAESGS